MHHGETEVRRLDLRERRRRGSGSKLTGGGSPGPQLIDSLSASSETDSANYVALHIDPASWVCTISRK